MMIYGIIFIFGAIIGSFLNVCIYRIPRNESIVRPASRCTSCGNPVRFYDNVPILSFIVLGGKCRYCKSRLSLRYPLIELLNAVLYVLVFDIYGAHSPWIPAAYFAFVSSLVVIFFIDLDYQIIPDSITLPGIPVALVLGAFILPDPFMRDEMLGFRSALIGFLAGGGFFYFVAVAGRAVFKKDAMGGGDIKMMAMVGGLLGWKAVILTTFMGSLFGSIAGISLIALKGREWGSKIAFGPCLAAGALMSLFWGQEILKWYFNA